MEFDVPRSWFRFRLTLLENQTILLDAVDERGRRWTADRDDLSNVSLVHPAGAARPFTVIRPAGLDAAMAAAIDDLPQVRPGALSRPPLPVFVEPPSGLAQLGWEAAPIVAPTIPPDRFVQVVLGTRTPARAGLRLPLRLLLVGDVGGDVLDVMRSASSWFRRESGLVEPAWVRSPDGARDLLRGRAYDAVVSDPTAAVALSAGRTLHTLGLVVQREDGAPPPTPRRLARSDLSVAATAAPMVLNDFFESLAHDLPLHHAVADMSMRHPQAGVRLRSTPEAVHDLRLMNVFVELASARNDLEGRVGLSDIAPEVSQALVVSPVEIDFGSGTSGLQPLGDAVARVELAERVLADLPDDEPGLNERVLDVMLSRGADVVAAERSAFVSMGCSLQAGGQYLLQIRVGLRSTASIVLGDQTPLNLLLPAREDGHDLEIAVHPDEFELGGPAVVPLFLPIRAASDTVTFALTAPVRVGPASLRIGAYFEGNLLQTLRVTTRIDGSEEAGPTVITQARVEFTATAHWTDIDRFGARYLSMVLNAHPFSPTHLVYIKSADATAAYRLPDVLTKKVVKPARSALTKAASASVPHAAATIRTLAALGRTAWDSLYNGLRDPAIRGQLRALRTRDDETLQITRADVYQSVPWSLVYDWDKPRGAAGPVCWGRKADRGCDHRATDGVLCVRGFWGVRHILEERIGQPRGDEHQGPLRRGSRLGVDLALALDPRISPVVALMSDLAGVVEVRRIEPEARLLDHLWDVERRAPLVAVLGHHDAATQALECGTSERVLTPSMISDHSVAHGDWAPPGPLMLLLACESGTVSEDSVSSHVDTLTGVGASAVVATECVVRANEVRHFATALLTELNDPHTSLGKAMQRTRARRLAEQDVTALGFVAFGSADVSVGA